MAPGWQSGGPTPPRKHGLATAALVLGIIGIVACFFLLPSLLAVIFGAVSLSAIKKSDGQLLGRSQALWGLILGIVGLLMFAGLVVIGIVADDETSSGTDIEDILDDIVDDTVADDGNTSVFAVDVGDCITVPTEADVVQSVDVIDCDEPHDGEVYFEGDLDGDRPFPGAEVIRTEVEQACDEAFEPFVGTAYEQSVYGIFYFTPLSQGWTLGDTAYTCIVTAPSGETLTGTVEGAGR